MVVEGLEAGGVPRAEKHPPAPVPDGEREITQEARGTGLAPALPGPEDELRVADPVRGGEGKPEGRDELRAIVEPRVGGDDDVAGLAASRERRVERVARAREHPLAETDRTIEPAVRRVVGPRGEALEHPVEVGRRKRGAIEAPHGGDAAHGLAGGAGSATPGRPARARRRSTRVTRAS